MGKGLYIWILVLLTVFALESQAFSFKSSSMFVRSDSSGTSGCDNIREQRNPCEYVRENCLDDKFLISYMELYYCKWAKLPGLFFFVTTIWIITLFYILYTIADNHFTVALQALSDFCNLSPDMAGLTFLAFGNGAPDFFTSLAGVQDNPDLILSGSVGSGLFITCFVLGFVIIMAGKGLESDNYTRDLSPIPFIRNMITYATCLIFTLVICVMKEIHYGVAVAMIVTYCLYISLSISYYIYCNQKRKRKLSEQNFNSNSPIVSPERAASLETFDTRKTKFSTIGFLHDVCGFADKNIIQRIIFFVSFPIDFLVALTIPPLNEESFDPLSNSYHNRKLLRIRTIVNPFFSLLFVMLIFEKQTVYINDVFPYYGLYLIIAFALSVALYFTTDYKRKPKFFMLHVCFGFVICIVWMYAASNELVSALVAFGHIFGIPKTVLGVTVLSWGNSFGDLVADIATSKIGYFETAATAVFSGPIQNVLLTMGITLLSVAVKSPDKIFKIPELEDDIFIGFSFLIFAFLLTCFGTMFLFRYQIPKKYGYMLIGIYVSYLPFAIMAGAGIFPGLN